MDFSVSDEARDLAALTRDLAASGRPLWPALAEAGVLAAALPKRAGGEGYGLTEQCAILVELGRAAATVAYLPSIVAADALARFGTDDQVDTWARPAARGEIVLAVAAQPARANPADGWRLDGTIPAVAAAPDAALVLVPTSAGVFLVGPGDTGVTIDRQQVAGGPGAGRLDLTGVTLGADRRIDDPAAAPWLAAHLTVGTCAAQLGVLDRALEMTAGYARTRTQFGRPIGAFPAVAHRLADAYVEVECLRLALWQAVWRLAEQLPADSEVATAGFWAAEAGHRVAHTAVHVHGGVGLDLEYPLHRYFLAADHHQFQLGGATAQLLELGVALAGGAVTPR